MCRQAMLAQCGLTKQTWCVPSWLRCARIASKASVMVILATGMPSTVMPSGAVEPFAVGNGWNRPQGDAEITPQCLRLSVSGICFPLMLIRYIGALPDPPDADESWTNIVAFADHRFAGTELAR